MLLLNSKSNLVSKSLFRILKNIRGKSVSISVISLLIFHNSLIANTHQTNQANQTSKAIKGTIARLTPGGGTSNKNSIDTSIISNTSIISPQNFKKSNSKVILFVWDGLRPDVISPINTPNLFKLKNQGTYFSDHHSSYPTVTMNNANSLATGNYSGKTGFYGNTAWRPDVVSGKNSKVDFMQPVFTQSHKVFTELDKIKDTNPIIYVETLIQIARKYGLKTAQVGKAGPIALQDAHTPTERGIVLTSDVVYPLEFAKNLAKKGYALPGHALEHMDIDKIPYLKQAEDPMRYSKTIDVATLDGSVPLIGLSNPENATSAIARQGNEYMMDIYLKEILPEHKPDLSVVWFREPDTTAHTYGPGSKSFYAALKNQDQLLGKLLLYMEKLGLNKNTNLMIVSDHGHNNVSGDTDIFPLREIKNSSIGEVSKNGYSVSGMVRVADLLTKAGFKAYDGDGCSYNPVLHGIFPDRKTLFSIYADQNGDVCNEGPGRLYTTESYKVPDDLPSDAIIVAANGGSVYIYVPSEDKDLVKKVVRFLQSRQEFDSIFVDSQYGDLPGTLPLRKVQFFDENQERHSDILVSMSYNDKQIVQGLPGTIYSSTNILVRGSHGTMSPVDIHNVLIGYGPDFKSKYTNVLPTANVDVPVSIAYLLNLPLNNRTGRMFLEAIKGSGIKASDYELKYKKLQPTKPATGLKISKLSSLDGKDIVDDKDSYTFVMNTKELYYKGQMYNYIDSAKAIRY